MISVQATVQAPNATLLIFISLLKQADVFEDCEIRFKMSEDFIQVSRVLFEEQIPEMQSEVERLEADLRKAIPENVEINVALVPDGDTEDKLDFLAGTLLEQAQSIGAMLQISRSTAVNVDSCFAKQDAVQRALMEKAGMNITFRPLTGMEGN